MRHLKLIGFVLVFTLVTVLLIPVQWLALRFNRPIATVLPVHYHRFVAWLLGVKVSIAGQPSLDRPLLLMSNHISWLDIVVLSTVMPVSFIAKSEVSGWPLFGTLARLQRTIFVDRNRRAAAADTAREMAERLADGEAIVLFAEGTTSDGNRVLPFRSPLVGAAREAVLAAGEGSSMVVQPVALSYPNRDGVPLGRRNRPEIAWYGDMELGPHLAGVIMGGPVDAVVSFGTPILFEKGTDRKHVTRLAEAEVRTALHALRREPVIDVKTVLTGTETG